MEVAAPRTDKTNHEDIEESEEDKTQVETSGGDEGQESSEGDLHCFITQQEMTDEILHGRQAIEIVKVA